jgi:hypothetical protein
MIRRLPLFLLLAVCAVTLGAGNLAAETPDKAPADKAPAVAPATSGDSVAGLDDGVPAPEWLTCSAMNDCDGGTPVSCTGTSTCTVNSNGVTCDGNFHSCPDFCSVSLVCNCWCGGTATAACTSNSGDCAAYPNKGVSCDGTVFTCFAACNSQQC